MVFDDEDSDREVALPSFRKRSFDDGEYSQSMQQSAKKRFELDLDLELTRRFC